VSLNYQAASKINIALGLTSQHLGEVSNDHFLHQSVIPAWKSLKEHALKDGFELTIVSSYRSFERQLTIWNNKFNEHSPVYNINEQQVDMHLLSNIEKIKAIMLFSALPGASRHHWGTDIDVYAKNLLPNGQMLALQVWEYEDNGPMSALSQWLDSHIEKYGFFRPYDQYRGGISREPWHISYKAIADEYQNLLTLDALASVIEKENISGKRDILQHLPDLYKQFITNIGN